MEQNADFIAEHGIEFIDATEKCDTFMKEYKAGKVWKGSAVKPAPGQWEGGQDIAFKDNLGIDGREYILCHEGVEERHVVTPVLLTLNLLGSSVPAFTGRPYTM